MLTESKPRRRRGGAGRRRRRRRRRRRTMKRMMTRKKKKMRRMPLRAGLESEMGKRGNQCETKQSTNKSRTTLED